MEPRFEEHVGFEPEPSTVLVVGMSMAFALPEDENDDEAMVFVTFEGALPAGDEQVMKVSVPLAFFEEDFDNFLTACQTIAEKKAVRIAEDATKKAAEKN